MERPAKSDLVAVALPPGPRWRDALAVSWDADAAVLPLDHRLPAAETRRILDEGRPTAFLDEGGLRRLEDGVPVDPSVALVVPTSGTTGGPRLVDIEHRALRAAVDASSEALGAGSDAAWLCCLPLAHMGGLLTVARSLLVGSRLVVHPGFDPEAVAAEPGVAYLSVVPTMLGRLLDSGADLARFHAILVGGAALPDRLASRAHTAGARIVETYGLTESCGGVVYDGRPLRGVEVGIGDGGAIVLGGPTLMRGYRLRPGESAAALAGGVLHTRDAGFLDGEGRLRVLGRLDEVIVTGGEKVWPSEVEAVLREHPAVADVAVTGRSDPEWGRRVTALVVPTEPDDAPSLEALREFARPRLARYKLPAAMAVVRALPRTTSGKLRRHLLPP